MLKTIYRASVVLLLIVLPVAGQTAEPTPDQTSKPGAITGRVVNESGQPLPNARISVYPIEGPGPIKQAITNREGTFKVTDLASVAYSVSVDMPGYIRASADAQNDPSERQYRVGDSVTISLTKGGVITGIITNAAGDPVIGIPVRAQMVRRDQQPTEAAEVSRESTADDRGVYRIYGLPTGAYIVSAGGSRGYSSGPLGAFDTFLPTYAPSSTRDSAAEVRVRVGEETSNVDISFRGEVGKTITGRLSGTGFESGFTVNLTMAASADSESEVSRFSQPGNSHFAFYGLADGDYYLTAQSYSQTGERGLSEPKLIKVRGADINDVDLIVKPLGSISGRVLLEESKANECQVKQPPAFKEMSISAWIDDNDPIAEQVESGSPVNPDARGNFTIRNLAPSQYYFAARVLPRSWYLKAITILPSATAANATAARPGKPTDATRVWTTIKAGEQRSGLNVTFAQGGASLEGQVVLSEGEKLQQKLFVYLVPSEREAANELLRFYGGVVGEEGKLGLHNIAPGRYWILTQPVGEDPEDAPIMTMRLPDATETRARLRRDAEAAKTELELKPCQSLTDYRLPIKLPAK